MRFALLISFPLLIFLIGEGMSLLIFFMSEFEFITSKFSDGLGWSVTDSFFDDCYSKVFDGYGW
jgi:hypothetical protein